MIFWLSQLRQIYQTFRSCLVMVRDLVLTWPIRSSQVQMVSLRLSLLAKALSATMHVQWFLVTISSTVMVSASFLLAQCAMLRRTIRLLSLVTMLTTQSALALLSSIKTGAPSRSRRSQKNQRVTMPLRVSTSIQKVSLRRQRRLFLLIVASLKLLRLTKCTWAPKALMFSSLVVAMLGSILERSIR